MFQIDTLLDSERSWLERQPPFAASWAAGCRWAAQAVERFWHEDAARVLTAGAAACEALAERCQTKVWLCWAHHWQQTARSGVVDGMQVAQSLRDGVRPANGAAMRGDPLRDVVLAQGCLEHDERALAILLQEYRVTFEDSATAVLRRPPSFDAFDDFVDTLVGVHGAARLRRYSGFTSLASWLRLVVRNHVVSQQRSQRAREFAESLAAEPTGRSEDPAAQAERRESVARFGVDLRRACSELSEAQRLALVLHCHGWSNHAIARRLGVSDSRASRIRSEAVRSIGGRLPSNVVDDVVDDGFDEQLRSWLSERLLHILRGTDVEAEAGRSPKEQ